MINNEGRSARPQGSGRVVFSGTRLAKRRGEEGEAAPEGGKNSRVIEVVVGKIHRGDEHQRPDFCVPRSRAGSALPPTDYRYYRRPKGQCLQKGT